MLRILKPAAARREGVVSPTTRPAACLYNGPMTCEVSDRCYTFLGVRADGGVPVMDLRPALDDEPAILFARALLQEHRTCTRLEVWRDGEIVTVLSRGDTVDARQSSPPNVTANDGR